jgi:hypothetical protein
VARMIVTSGCRYAGGAALVDYLRHVRPNREDPHLFLTVYAPFGPMAGGTVRMVWSCNYACDRTRIPRVGRIGSDRRSRPGC